MARRKGICDPSQASLDEMKALLEAERRKTLSLQNEAQKYEQERTQRLLLEQELREEREKMSKEREQFLEERNKWGRLQHLGQGRSTSVPTRALLRLRLVKRVG